MTGGFHVLVHRLNNKLLCLPSSIFSLFHYTSLSLKTSNIIHFSTIFLNHYVLITTSPSLHNLSSLIISLLHYTPPPVCTSIVIPLSSIIPSVMAVCNYNFPKLSPTSIANLLFPCIFPPSLDYCLIWIPLSLYTSFVIYFVYYTSPLIYSSRIISPLHYTPPPLYLSSCYPSYVILLSHYNPPSFPTSSIVLLLHYPSPLLYASLIISFFSIFITLYNLSFIILFTTFYS